MSQYVYCGICGQQHDNRTTACPSVGITPGFGWKSRIAMLEERVTMLELGMPARPAVSIPFAQDANLPRQETVMTTTPPPADPMVIYPAGMDYEPSPSTEPPGIDAETAEWMNAPMGPPETPTAPPYVDGLIIRRLRYCARMRLSATIPPDDCAAIVRALVPA